MDFVADTTFLVGLWRRQAWALSFAHREAEKSIGIPWVVLGEFWHGAHAAGHDSMRVESFLQLGIHLVDPLPVIPVYAQLCAELQRSTQEYRMIGQNDLWIAASALAVRRPLVTRNQRHFRCIRDLQLNVLNAA